ncbi:MAG: F0F1 ATP synthase subunit epsilon [Amylibacter sp.]|jgi:F-type H+-transporting ATPase subunit epsilon|tara:strand:+ start:2355 stop:2744 length:390 start_codon:yes stop_codon:yes gene_type:complete
MATIQFDLVSPERKLASVEALEIQIPGADGDFTAMAEHAPMLTTLRPGLLSVTTNNNVTEYIVTGGFVEISGTNASVLAEQALPKAEVTREVIDNLIAVATAALENIPPEDVDAANKRLSDTRILLELI